ncbi:MAG: DUF2127 domain-containing protein [Acidobacteriota bacterium]
MRQHDPMLRLIGAFKLVKALLLVAVALSLLDAGWRHELRVVARAVGVDPDHHLADVIARLRDLDHAHRLEIGIALCVYAAMFACEGIGLVLRKLWAEYLTIVITTSFVPFEIYELVEKKSALKALVIAINVAGVIYLLWRLRRDKHWPWHRTR